MSVEPRRRLFTVDEYHAMARAGVLGEDDRVELLEGEVVETGPIGSRHNACVARLNRYLSGRAGDNAIVWVQSSIRLNDFAEPEPDAALLRPRDDYYAEAHPRPEDVLLVVEVADTSADYDRERKIPLYARSGVPEVWLVDLEEGRIELYRSPSADGYRELLRPGRDEVLRPVELPELEVAVREVLPGS